MQNTTPTNTFQGNIFHAKVDVAVFVATFTQEVRSLFKRGVKAKSPHYKLDLPSLYTIDLVLLRNKMFWLKYNIGPLKTDFLLVQVSQLYPSIKKLTRLTSSLSPVRWGVVDAPLTPDIL